MANMYRKKPIAIQAIELSSENVEELEQFADKLEVMSGADGKLNAKICTLEGDMECVEGDFIIKGVDDELYPCKRSIFQKTYDLVE